MKGANSMRNKSMKILNMALCANRHNIPEATDGYIFREIADPTNTWRLEKQAFSAIWAACNAKKYLVYLGSISPRFGNCDLEDALCIAKDVHLNLYVTGLTPALIAVLNICREESITVDLYHYDRETGGYFIQKVK